MKASVRRGGWWLLFFVSGAPGLMAQLAWTRIIGAGLGHEFPALTGVISAYFAGLALGAVGFSRWGGAGRRPEWVYGALEIGSGLWILGTTPFLTVGLETAQKWMGVEASWWREAVVGFGFPLLIIGPTAAALGATLPAMEKVVRPLEKAGRAVAGLYAFNTAGAFVGIALALGVAMPGVGFRGTLVLAAIIQLICGCGAVVLARVFQGATRKVEDPDLSREVRSAEESQGVRSGGIRPETRSGSAGRPSGGALHKATPGGNRSTARSWTRVMVVSGFLGMGFELLGVRALAQTTENTVQTYAWVVGSVLAGTMIGAAWNRRQVQRGKEWDAAVLLGGLSVACGLSLGVMGWSGTMLELLSGRWGAWMGEAWVTAAVFLVPSAGMGMVFGRWVQQAGDTGGEGGVGRAIAWNCLGGALAGPVLVGAILPWAGLKGALVMVSAGYLLLVPWVAWRGWSWVLPVGFAVAVAWVPAGVRFLKLPEGASLVRSWDGRMASVAVIRTADGERVLRVNNHFQQGGTATAVAARRHAHLPLLAHPAPRSVLFLGIGTGITMGAAADHPDLKADGVELLPEVVEALSYFEPENRSPMKREDFRVRTGDARRFVRTATRKYDVIIADLFHPAEDGAGMLYTRDHFESIRDRLEPGGVFCQWLPLHQLDVAGFRDVGATFLDVFPEASLWMLRFNVDVPVVGLVGGRDRWVAQPDALARRMGTGDLAAALKPVALGEPVRFLGCRMADSASLRRLVRGGRVATDDLPRVMYDAAGAVYRKAAAPHERLLELLADADPGFSECLVGEERAPWLVRLERFRRARDRHLHGLGEELAGRMRGALEDYLASAELSGEYTAGYAQAVLVASAYAKQDPTLARAVLERLVAVRPEQGLAKELLGRLGR